MDGAAAHRAPTAPPPPAASSPRSRGSRAPARHPRHVTEQAIRVALDLDGDLGDTLDEFLARVMTPAADAQNH